MRDAAFMGAVAATAMHDMLNVFSTIREVSGLMEDLLRAGKDFRHAERFLSLIQVIQDQVRKGGGLADELNRLGHLHESCPDGGHDVGRLLRMLLALVARKVAARSLRVQVEEPAGPVRLQDGALDFIKAFHEVLEACLHLPPASGQDGLHVQVVPQGDRGTLLLHVPGAAALRDALAGSPFGITIENAQALRLEFPLRFGQDPAWAPHDQ